MYRIELSPGEETAFRSIEELAVAIRRKVVTARARIYHNATGKWLPIQFHPHYKLALTMPLTQADLVAGPPVTPLSGLKLGEPAKEPSTAVPSSATREAATQAALSAWPEPKPEPPAAPKPAPRMLSRQREPQPQQPPIKLGTPYPEPRRFVEPFRSHEPRRPAPTRIEQGWTGEPSRASGSRRRRKPLRALRVALAGAVLIACGHLLASAASPSDPEVGARPRAPRRLIEATAKALQDVPPRTVAAVMPGIQSIPVPGLTTTSSQAETELAASQSVVDSVPEPIRVDSLGTSIATPVIHAAPDAGELTAAVPDQSEILAPQLIDSSGKKALKRILRTIEGPSTPERKPPTR